MAYQKITVTDGEIITDDWGNHIQTQYENAMADFGKLSLTVGAGQKTTSQKMAEIIAGGVKDFTLPYSFQTTGRMTAYSNICNGYGSLGGLRTFPINTTQILVVASNATGKNLIGYVATLTDDATNGRYYAVGTVAESTAQSYWPSEISNIIQLTSTTFLVTWSYYMMSTSSPTFASVITVSGTTVTFGAIQTLTSAYRIPQLMYLSSTTALMMFRYSTTQVGAAILTISGTTVTMGAVTYATAINAAYALDFITTDQSNNRGILFVGDNSSSYGAIGISVSGTTITWGTWLTITTCPSNGYTFNNFVLVSTNKVLITYNASSGEGSPKYAKILTINTSNVITGGTQVTVSSNLVTSGYSGTLIKVSDTRVDYYNSSTSHYILTISGTSITGVTSSNNLLPTPSPRGIQFVAANGQTWPYCAVVYGVADCITVRDVCLEGSGEVVGLSKETKASGEAVIVDAGNILDGFTGLTVGAAYYVQNGGAVSTNVSDEAYKLGYAISETQIRRAA